MRSLAAALLVGLGLAACTAPTEDLSSTSAAQSVSGRWIPSDAAKTAGAEVKIAYESPPKWIGTKGCGGKLLPGSQKLGAFLQDKFTVITSVGGYSCRQNTANAKETSVHGTGRAIDIMIPTVGGTADNTAGDPIANWLVQNATRIGIQLVIWDHSIWHCDGRNDTPYTGPVPHVDHIHAELTKAAAAETTTWFTAGGDDSTDTPTSTDDDATTNTTDTNTDTDTNPDTDWPDDAWPPLPDVPSDVDAGAGTDAGPAPDAGTGPAATPPSKSAPPAQPTTPPVLTDDHDDGPATDAKIPASTKKRTKSPAASADAEDSGAPSAGCSATSAAMPDASAIWMIGLVGAVVVLRRRRRA